MSKTNKQADEYLYRTIRDSSYPSHKYPDHVQSNEMFKEVILTWIEILSNDDGESNDNAGKQ